MRLLVSAPALLGLVALCLAGAKAPKTVLILTGDSRGSLSPCGCSKPMVGGLKRLATIVRAYDGDRLGILLANASLTGGLGRQEELKAQTMAASLKALGATAVHLTPAEAQSPEIRLTFENILGGAVLTGDRTHTEAGGYRIVVAPEASLGDEEAAALANHQRLIVMLDGGLGAARQLAVDHPSIALIEYRQDGRSDVSSEGTTLLATPGSKLQYAVVIEDEGGSFAEPISIPLDERVRDDPATTRLYDDYLQRVDSENLLSQIPRPRSELFAGSKRCAPCHATAYHVWAQSGHASALKTLDSGGHGRDPECVSCHVVGLDSIHGFQSESLTPQLVGVGCESCHGPGLGHARAPRQRPMPRIGPAACTQCHVADHSPEFDFSRFWPRIRH